MKFARKDLFIFRGGFLNWAGPHRGLLNSNSVRRSNSNYTFAPRRTTGRLAAHWHVCPQSRRPECSWSLETAVSDGQLCRYLGRRCLIRRDRGPLSQIRNMPR